VTRRGSVFVQAYGGTTFGYDNTGLPQFFLGGVGRLNAHGTNELRTDQYFLFRAGYLHELWTLPPLVGNKVYVMSAYELGKPMLRLPPPYFLFLQTFPLTEQLRW
jgi:NTE family protein